MARNVLLFICLTACGLLIPASPSWGRDYRFTNYTLGQGLSQSQINCCFQDSKGYMWFGSFGGGAGRFDGRRFENFSGEAGLINSVILCFYEDPNGRIWMGGDKGFEIFDGASFSAFNAANGFTDAAVYAIIADNGGDIWIASDAEGVFRVNNGNVIYNYAESDGLPSNTVYCLLKDSRERIWMGCENGAACFDGRMFRNYTVRDGLPHNRIRWLMEDNRRQIWFATPKGVAIYDGARFSAITRQQGLISDDVRTTFQDRDGNIWIGTVHGVSRLSGETFTHFTTENGLVQNRAESIIQDRENNIWIGTESGVSSFHDEAFQYITTKHGLPDNMVWGFREAPDGVMWISTGAGTVKYSGDRVSPIPELGAVGAFAAYPLHMGQDNILRFGADKRFFHYTNRGLSQPTLHPPLPETEIIAILTTAQNGTWLGSNGDGLFHISGNQLLHLTQKEGLINNYVSALAEDDNGNILCGAERGLSIYNPIVKSFTNLPRIDGHELRFIYDIRRDREGCFWFCLYGKGLLRARPVSPTQFRATDLITVRDGLRDDKLMFLHPDRRGGFWLGGITGVNWFDLENYLRTGRKVIHSYGRDDGFTPGECNQGAVFEDSAGRMWFGSTSGAVILDPRYEKKNAAEPVTHITGFRFFFEPLDLSPYSKGRDPRTGLPVNLTLPHHLNHITFYYTGVCTSAPNRVRYMVRLEGFGGKWLNMEANEYATWSNLPPGEYCFSVKSSVTPGQWSLRAAAFNFVILSPFYRRTWFIVLMAALFGLNVFLLVSWRTRRLKKRRRELENLVQQRTLELQQEKLKALNANRELEARVEERSQKLRQANSRLLHAQKMEAIGALAGGVAHDLNNILAGVVTYPDLLLLKTAPDDPRRKHLEIIKKSGEKAAAIVQDLLTLARRNVPALEPINLNAIIADFLRSPEFLHLINLNGRIRVETHLTTRPDLIEGSYIHLFKTVMNLAVNAVEAMPEGGTLAISTENIRLEQAPEGFADFEPGPCLQLTLADTGVGIPAEDLEHIFEPFFTRKQPGKRSGSGLGMTVAWGVIREHRGHIEVRSQPGAGTTFTVWLPAAPADAPAPQPPPQRRLENYRGAGETVLIVDDEEQQREITSMMLRELGYQPLTAASGQEALKTLARQPADLLVLDMIMRPGWDGLETFRRILTVFPKQKAVILSGYSESERVKEAQLLGAGAYIKKPCLIEELAAAVRSELDKNI